MIKNLTGGAVINYAADFPADAAAFDGALFYKSAGTDQGLYIFSFNQDANLSQVGDQVVQAWNPIVTNATFVAKAGDTMSGPLGITGGGSTNDPYGRVSVTLPSDSNSYGYYGLTRQGQIGWSIGVDTSNRLFFGTGGAGALNNVSNRPVTIGAAGDILIGGGVVWHSGNDGAGSGLDADLLDGQNSSYFLSASNLTTGTLDAARLPFTPVQQGGGTGQLGNKVYIGWNNTQLLLQVDNNNFGATWPINVAGNAGTANFANSATNATNAVNATNATTATTATTATNADGANYLHPYVSSGIGGVKTGRNVWAAGAYTYNSHSDPNSPTAYLAATGFGAGAGGAGEVGVSWIGAGTGMWYRSLRDTTDSWSAWTRVLDTANYSSYAPTLTGGGASGTWGINITGSAGSVSSVPWTSVTGRPTNVSSFTNDSGYITGTNVLVRTNDVWQTSAEGNNRLYFTGSGRTLYSSNNGHEFRRQDSTALFTVDNSGNTVATGNVTAYSDRRLKKEIAPITDALTKIRALTGVTYTRVNSEERGTGLIAQDVQAVLPEAVQADPDGMLSLAYGNLAGLLVQALKELSEEVRLLKAQNKALRSSIRREGTKE
jgi:hypothetical protein